MPVITLVVHFRVFVFNVYVLESFNRRDTNSVFKFDIGSFEKAS